MCRLSGGWWVALAILGHPSQESAAQESARPAQIAEGPIRRQEAGFRALYTIHRDGTNPQYLVAAPRMISSATPDWSHDGRMVVFDALEKIDDVTRSRLFVYAIERGGLSARGGIPFGTWTTRYVEWFRDLGFLEKPGTPTKAAADVEAFAKKPAR